MLPRSTISKGSFYGRAIESIAFASSQNVTSRFLVLNLKFQVHNQLLQYVYLKGQDCMTQKKFGCPLYSACPSIRLLSVSKKL